MFFNNDLLVAAGVDPAKPPATWDEMLAAVPKLFKKEGENIAQFAFVPLWGSGGALAGWMIPYWQQNGELLSADERKSTLNNDKMVKAFEYTKRIYDLQGGRPAIEKARGDQVHEKIFSGGKLAMYFETYDTPFHQDKKDAWGKIKWSVNFAPIPPGGRPATYGGGWSNVIPMGAKNPDVAFAFIEFLTEPSVEARWQDFLGRIPSRKSVANSNDWQKGQPIRAHAAKEMAGANWVVTAPGGGPILQVHIQLAVDIYDGKKTIQEALKEADEKTQQLLDEAEKTSVVK